MTSPIVRIGTAGWAVPRRWSELFPANERGLARYAGPLQAAEINTTFYRPHRLETFERWAAGTPDDFRFSVKAPKTITHEARLADAEPLIEAFLVQARALGGKLGALLFQLPPSLAFDPAVAPPFLKALRDRADEPIALEPRHASWFEDEADALLAQNRVARVAADPAKHAGAGEPGGWRELAYYRLHGSPRMYFSEYGDAYLETLARTLGRSQATETWCVFDNTASGAAAGEAVKLRRALETMGR